MLNRLFRRALKKEDGTVAAMFALSLLFIVPLLVLVTDMTYGYFVKAKLQTTASIAALAAASQLDPENADAVIADIKTAARIEADLYADTKNMGVGQDGAVTNENDEDVIFGTWIETPTLGEPEFCPDTEPCFSPGGIDLPLDAVKVFARRSDTGTHANALPLFIGAVLPELNVQPSAVATAKGGKEYTICILALNQTDPEAIWINGTNDVSAEECGVCSNGGIRANGNPTIELINGDMIYWNEGPGLIDVGNVHWEPEGSLYPHPENLCTDPIAETVPAPFENNWDDTCADLTDPLVWDALFFEEAVPGGTNLQIHPLPGLSVCGEIRKTGNDLLVDGLSPLSSNDLVSIEFMPGLHHFKAKPGSEPQNFNLNGGSDIGLSGVDVTFLLSDIQLDWLGASEISLAAPSGTVLGLPGFNAALDEPNYLFYQNSDSPDEFDSYVLEHELGGTNGANLSGLMYFGYYSTFWFHGTQDTGEASDACLAVIAGNIQFSGGTDINFSPAGCADKLPRGKADLYVRLVD